MTEANDKGSSLTENLVLQVKNFALLEGRQPRVMISGQIPVANYEDINKLGVVLADLGFDVDLGPFFTLEVELAKNAVENDVDLLILMRYNNSHSPNSLDKIRQFLDDSQRSDMMLLFEVSGVEQQQQQKPEAKKKSNTIAFSGHEVLGVLSDFFKNFLS